MGETTITGTPERIVALSHLPIELLYELDIKPVGVSTWEKTPLYGIRWEEYYSGISKKWPNMVNVGSVNEPNFEVIVSLKPDLIPYSPFGHVQIYDELSEIAPTIYYSQFLEMENMTQLERLEWQTMGIADALNRHDEGMAMIERMNAKSDEAEGKLEAVGLKGEKFIFSQIFLDENPPLSVFGRDSRQSEMLESIGLVPALSGTEEIDDSGRIYVGLEQKAALDAPDVHVIYLHYIEDPAPDFAENPVWNQLSFVQDGRIYAIGVPPPAPTINSWGGPQTQMQFVDKVVEVMTNSSSSSNS